MCIDSIGGRSGRLAIFLVAALAAVLLGAPAAGAAVGPKLVKDIRAGGSSEPLELTALGSVVLFTAQGGGKGRELWISDGTQTGTRRVKDIRPGPAGSGPHELVVFDGLLFFGADDGASGTELWMSDGTNAGTRRLTDINPGAGDSGITGLTAVQDRLFFFAIGAAGLLELWKSDGTPQGTNRVKQLFAGATLDAAPAGFQGRLFFGLDLCGGNVCSSAGLWRSNGTSASTKQFHFVADNEYPRDITRTATWLYWTTDSGLFRSDGTQAGTSLIFPVEAFQLTRVGKKLFFGAIAENGDNLLWVTPGRSGREDPEHLFRFEPDPPLTSFANVGGRLFFSGAWIEPNALWRSDGTPGTTDAVQGGLAGPDQAFPRNIKGVDGIAYFAALDKWATCEDPCNEELWRSNGQDAGTFRVADIRPGPASSLPRELTNVNGTLFFTANDGVHGRELWRYVP